MKGQYFQLQVVYFGKVVCHQSMPSKLIRAYKAK